MKGLTAARPFTGAEFFDDSDPRYSRLVGPRSEPVPNEFWDDLSPAHRAITCIAAAIMEVHGIRMFGRIYRKHPRQYLFGVHLS